VLEFRWLAETVEKELGQIKQPALIFHRRFDDQSDIRNPRLLQRNSQAGRSWLSSYDASICGVAHNDVRIYRIASDPATNFR
jgi:hypothetical protein